MKAICEGRSSRNDVVQQNLDQYRAVFTLTQRQINVLKAVSIMTVRIRHPTNHRHIGSSKIRLRDVTVFPNVQE